MDYLYSKHNEISRGFGDSKLFNVVEIPPFERTDNQFIKNQSINKDKKLIDARYATEAGYFQRNYEEANVVIYGPGNPDCIHKAGESISVDNLIQYSEELNELLIDYLKYNSNYIDNNKVYVYK